MKKVLFVAASVVSFSFFFAALGFALLD